MLTVAVPMLAGQVSALPLFWYVMGALLVTSVLPVPDTVAVPWTSLQLKEPASTVNSWLGDAASCVASSFTVPLAHVKDPTVACEADAITADIARTAVRARPRTLSLRIICSSLLVCRCSATGHPPG
jgi:hypothetical protein